MPGACSLKADDPVRIIKGPFADQVTTIQELKNNQCKYLVELFGKKQSFKYDTSNIEAA